jgi:hypothetical protein
MIARGKRRGRSRAPFIRPADWLQFVSLKWHEKRPRTPESRSSVVPLAIVRPHREENGAAADDFQSLSDSPAGDALFDAIF